MPETAPRIFLTASLLSGPDVAEEGCSPRACCASLTSAGRSALSSTGMPRSVSTTFAVLSISSFALPIAKAGSSMMACWMRLSCWRIAEASVRLFNDSTANRGPTGGDVAGVVIDDVAIAAQRVEELAAVLLFETVHQPFEDAQHSRDVVDVAPVDRLQVLLGEGSAHAAVLVGAGWAGGKQFVLERGADLAHGAAGHEVAEQTAGRAADQVVHAVPSLLVADVAPTGPASAAHGHAADDSAELSWLVVMGTVLNCGCSVD